MPQLAVGKPPHDTDRYTNRGENGHDAIGIEFFGPRKCGHKPAHEQKARNEPHDVTSFASRVGYDG